MNITKTLPENGQALLLAALMVLSVVAMAALFAGSVAAQEHDVDVSFSEEEGDIGEEVTVSFDIDPALDDDAEVGSYDVEIAYDETVISFVEAEGVDLPDPTVNEPEDGTLSANAAQATGEPVPLTAAEFTFVIDGDGLEGGEEAAIELVDAESEFNDPIDPVTFESEAGSVSVVTADTEFTLDNLDPLDATVVEGEGPIDVSVDVTNEGEDPGEAELEATVTDDETGDVVFSADATVEVGAGETVTATFEDVPTQVLDIGDYTHAVESQDDFIEGSLSIVEEPPVPDLDGLAVSIEDGFTIGDDYPVNGDQIFDGSIYTPSGLTLPPEADEDDERLEPIVDGQHVGITGLPVQDEVYEYLTPPESNLLGFSTAEQTVAISFDDTTESPVELDFTQSLLHGLAPVAFEVDAFADIDEGNFSEPFVSEGGNSLVFEFDEDNITGGQSPTIQLNLEWAALDPVEGLDVAATNNIDYETDHELIDPDGDTVSDNFVTFETGASGISHADTAAGSFIGEEGSVSDLRVNPEADGAEDGTANPGAFLVRQGQIVTLEAEDRGDTISVFEAETEDGEFVLGDRVDAVDFDDTAPGQVANLNTANLTVGEQFFVTFGQDQSEAVALDVRPLDLEVSAPDSYDFFDLFERGTDRVPIPVEIESEDTTFGDIELWFNFEDPDGDQAENVPLNGTDIGEVIHVERTDTSGTGDRLVETVIPRVDLSQGLDEAEFENLTGDYSITALHADSGVTDTAEFTIEEAPVPDEQPADDVNIVSPNLFEPDVPGIFDRGDIIPIELELEGGNVATVTFGDFDEQNVEVSATVIDPTFVPAEECCTEVQFYLNTYQIGDEDRNQGFFTAPHDDVPTEVIDVEVNPGQQIDGGSAGGAVLSPGEVEDGTYPGLRYDLHAAGGFQPHTAPGVDRDDVNALDIEQRSTDDFIYHKAPGAGENALGNFVDDELEVDDILGLIDQGIVTPLETETVTETAEVPLTRGPAGQFVPAGPDDVVVVEPGEEFERTVFQDFVAEEDALIVQSQSAGIEGVLHEAEIRAGSDDPTSVLDRTQNHIVTDEFRNATTGEAPLIDYSVFAHETVAQLPSSTTGPVQTFDDRQIRPEGVDPNLPLEDVLEVTDPVGFGPEFGEVVAAQNDDGNLAEFFATYQLDSDTVGVELADLVPQAVDSLNFAVESELEPRGGTQPDIPESVNPELRENSLGADTTEELDLVQREIQFDDVHTFDGNLEVPGQENYELTGTSTAAPGTTVDIRIISVTGEDTPFAEEFGSVQTVAADEPGAPATWSVDANFAETRDDVAIQPGTEFTADISLAGTGLNLRSVGGVVLDDPEVETFQFNNQRTDGDTVRVAAYQANRISQIEILDADGDTIGETGVLDRDLNEQFSIEVDQLEENQDVTAVATIIQPEEGEVLAEETAQINVQDESAPFFDVRNLVPQSATVTQGDIVDVSADIQNIGDLADTQEITLEIDGLAFDDEVSLAGGESETVEFTVSTDDVPPGDYTHTISSANDSASGSLTIDPEPEDAEFDIVSFSPSDATVEQGDVVDVEATIQNVGDLEGTQTVTLDINGVEFTEDLTLGAGDVGTVSFSADTSDLEGEFTHTISTDDDSVSGSLTVQVDDDDDADDDGAGFGVAIAALALLGAALLAMRRQVE